MVRVSVQKCRLTSVRGTVAYWAPFAMMVRGTTPVTQKIFEYLIHVQRKTYEPPASMPRIPSEFTMDLDDRLPVSIRQSHGRILPPNTRNAGGDRTDGYIRTMKFTHSVPPSTSDYLMPHCGEFETEYANGLEVFSCRRIS